MESIIVPILSVLGLGGVFGFTKYKNINIIDVLGHNDNIQTLPPTITPIVQTGGKVMKGGNYDFSSSDSSSDDEY